jgi:hypothetical protein
LNVEIPTSRIPVPNSAPALTSLLAPTFIPLPELISPLTLAGIGELDEQMQPLRGLGKHKVSMVGVTEKLADGEQLGLMVYGYNLQYLTSLSRDLSVSGSVLKVQWKYPFSDDSTSATDKNACNSRHFYSNFCDSHSL